MRRRVAGQQEHRHAQQLMQLREDREAHVGEELQAARRGERADEGKVVERLIECERREEGEQGEDGEEGCQLPVAGCRPNAAGNGQQATGNDGQNRNRTKQSNGREQKQRLRQQREGQRAAQRKSETHQRPVPASEDDTARSIRRRSSHTDQSHM